MFLACSKILKVFKPNVFINLVVIKRNKCIRQSDKVQQNCIPEAAAAAETAAALAAASCGVMSGGGAPWPLAMMPIEVGTWRRGETTIGAPPGVGERKCPWKINATKKLAQKKNNV